MQIEGHLDWDDFLSISEDRDLNREYLMDERERGLFNCFRGQPKPYLTSNEVP